MMPTNIVDDELVPISANNTDPSGGPVCPPVEELVAMSAYMAHVVLFDIGHDGLTDELKE